MISALVCISSLINDLPTWKPNEFRDVNKYEVIGAPPHRGWITFRRKADTVNISFDVDESTPEYASKPILIAAFKSPPRVTPSGIPLGRQVLVSGRPGILDLSVVADWEQARVGLQTPRQARSSPTPFRPDDLSDEKPKCEFLLRQILATYASRRLSTSGQVSFSGKSFPSWRAQKSNATYVNLRDVSNSLGINVNFNDDHGRATFIWNGKTRLVALGSGQVKVGSEWQDLSDLVMLKDGKWLVPAKVFE